MAPPLFIIISTVGTNKPTHFLEGISK